MNVKKLHNKLKLSIERQKSLLHGSIVLNPVENFPFIEDLSPAASELHGLYNTDKIRSIDQRKKTKHQFSGRNRIAYDSHRIYRSWAKALHAEDVSMRLLSGLHAHIVVFMSITKPGDIVLLLPEIAGGHMSTKSILERLGLTVIEMEVNLEKHCVDVEATLKKIQRINLEVVFVDRSEGLVYENFSHLLGSIKAIKIFDASQYLSHIIAQDHPNPFDDGFDYIIATVHKNFPGPQKALIATRVVNNQWKEVLSGISTYVSNMHSFSTYSSGLTLAREEWISNYSSNLLQNTIELDKRLKFNDIPIISRPEKFPNTHHIWIIANSKEQAFKWFRSLELVRIHVNYRKLPYELGYGLRLGLTAVTRLGLLPHECSELAELVSSAIRLSNTLLTRKKVRKFANSLWSRNY